MDEVARLDEAIDYESVRGAPFGLMSRDDWRVLIEPTLRLDGDRCVFRYDPAIALPFKITTPHSAAAAEAATWVL